MILNRCFLLFNQLSHAGADGLMPADARRVILTNRVNLFLCTLAAFFIFPWAMKGSWFMVASNCFFVGFHSFLVWMNKKRRYFLPKFSLIVLLSTAIFMIVGMVGKVGDFQTCLIPIAGFSILFFDPKEKLQLGVGILYPLILLTILVVFDYQLFPNYVGEPLPGLTAFTYSMNLIMVITTSLYFYRTNLNTEKKYQHLYEEHIQAQKALDEERAKAIYASKMVSLGEMASGIAHEINGPLWLITVAADQLKRSVKNNEVNPELVLQQGKRISDTSARISEIIVALSKMARSGETGPLQEVCLKTLVSETLIICNHRFYLKSVKLEVNIPENIPPVSCRSVEISQVLLNLLNNAFDAVAETPDAVVEIKITSFPEKVKIVVQNNGPAIPGEIRERIFESFFTTKPIGKGTGLGLSISKKIIELHKGRMFLEDNAAETSFVVELPV